MPATFKWERPRDAIIEQGRNNLAVVRGALAQGLDRTVPRATLIALLEDAGMPIMGEAYDVSHPDLIVTGRSIYGQFWDTAIVRVKYETLALEFDFFPQTSWYVRDETSLTQEQTQLDVSGIPIDVNYLPPSATNTIVDYPRFNKFEPMRSLVLQATLSVRPSETVLNAVGAVNNATWFSKPVGYWLCAGVGAEASSGEPSKIKVSASFISKVHRDWKSYAFFIDETGRPPRDINPALVQAAVNTAYTTSMITSNGFVAVGLYEMQNFATVFGVGT
jgi:hypothetical protein